MGLSDYSEKNQPVHEEKDSKQVEAQITEDQTGKLNEEIKEEEEGN
jgi:hypothetical protein